MLIAGRFVWFIYRLNDPETGEIRYVGHTSDPARRLKDHGSKYDQCNRRKRMWIQELKAQGKKPVMEFIEHGVGLTDQRWKVRERYWITYFRSIGARLFNVRDGGEGQPCSEETKRRISIANHKNRLDNVDEWFWPRVNRSGGPDACWPWAGSLVGNVYGQLDYGSTPPRFALELHLGRKLLPGKRACHKDCCLYAHCCNPQHLYEGAIGFAESKFNPLPKGSVNLALRNRPNPKNRKYPVELIREIKFSNKSEAQLVAEFHCSKGLIWKVRTGRIWKDIKELIPCV